MAEGISRAELLNDLVSYNERHNEAKGGEQFRRPQPQPFMELRCRRPD